MIDCPGYSVERTLAQPGFWRGAAQTRAQCYSRDDSLLNGLSLSRVELIGAHVAAGRRLADSAEYRDWLRGAQ